MKRSRFTDSQIIAILKRAEAGTSVPELCREHGISSASFYKWRSKFGGMDAALMSRLKKLEEENRRLKKVYAEERLKSEIIQEVMAKSVEAVRPEADGTEWFYTDTAYSALELILLIASIKNGRIILGPDSDTDKHSNMAATFHFVSLIHTGISQAEIAIPGVISVILSRCTV